MKAREAFEAAMRQAPTGVILLEGRRSAATTEKDRARQFAEYLARQYPHARFRSGNADGADAAFTEGVAAVDPSRMELVLPFAGHRVKARAVGVTTLCLEGLDAALDEEIARVSIEATPGNHRLIRLRKQQGALAAKGLYLMRDTLKVFGHPPAHPRPVAAFFLVDPAEPEAGGTGHTLRVCRRLGVPAFLQAEWATWVPTQ